jgi:hypothetical protein
MSVEFKDICIDKEFEELLPKLTVDEFENLEQSILRNGVLDPLKLWEEPETGKLILIDGHNRYEIIKKNKLKFDIWNGFIIIHESNLSDRESVKEWMLEQQLGRRNLTELERYEIVQRFKDIIANKAKENQSLGGKGLQKIAKVNTRKVLADRVGVSEETYRKLDKIAQSCNEEVKQKLKDKKVSVDKAYKMVQEPKKEMSVTPMQKIEKVDSRIDEIEREISSLNTEKLALVRKRTMLFEALDMKCELKYELEHTDLCRHCIFYIEVDGHKETFVNCMVIDEEPAAIYMNKVPDKYKNDFRMLYRKAHLEDIEHEREENESFRKACENVLENTIGETLDKDFYKKCYRILAVKFHPDNTDGDMEDMKSLNELKKRWGI